MTPTPDFQRKFPLDTAALLPGSASSLTLGTSTAADVLTAIAANKPFPDREIAVASFGFETGAEEKFEFGQPGAGKATFSFAAAARTRLGIFAGARIMTELDLQDAGEIGLAFPDEEGRRYALFVAGFQAEAGVQASHPIGVVGSASFGAQVKGFQQLAVIQAFDAQQGARDVLAATFSNWKLPRHVSEASKLALGATLVAEAEGSLKLNVTGTLGYDFSFLREVEGLGLRGDIGLKLDLGLKAALGFEAAGRYLIALQRASDHDLRLRLFRMRQRGWNFGLNLAAKVTTETPLPDEVDDLVKSVFGVHGQQIVRDLKLIDQWTDPEQDLTEKLAGLGRETAMELFKKITGSTPGTTGAFSKAKEKLLGAVRQWEQLPDTVSGWLWKKLERGDLSGDRRVILDNTLGLLASPRDQTRQTELTRLLGLTGIDDEHGLQFLVSFADFGVNRGLAALLQDSAQVRGVAALTRDILNGGVIERLQEYVTQALNLGQILNFNGGAGGGGMKQVDKWLGNRLALFLGKKIDLEQVEEVRAAIHAVMDQRNQIYAKAKQALERRFDFELAYHYQSAVTKTALIDATFDTSQAPARALLAEILAESNFDKLMAQSTPGVTLGEGVLTHQIDRRATVEVTLPFYKSKEMTITESLAKVTAQEDGGRVLCYELEAENRVVQNRLRSQLAVAGAVPLRAVDGVRVYGTGNLQWSYRYDQVIRNARRPELERQAAPIIEQYFPKHFAAGGESSFSTYLSQLDRTLDGPLQNGPDEFGDLLVSLDLALPASVLGAWFQPRTDQEVAAAARAVSLRLQRSLQRLLPYFFFQDLRNLQQNPPAAALLVFASLPALNNFVIEGNRLADRPGAIWDVFSPELRRAAVNNATTAGQLGNLVADARARLLNAGLTKQAGFFTKDQVPRFLTGTSESEQFKHLVALMSVATKGAEDALKDLRQFTKAAAERPSKAIDRLAEFGATITSTFNSNLASVYDKESRALRPLGSMIFLEAACALDPALAKVKPKAVLSVTVLKPACQFVPENFLRNKRPAPEDVALEQRIVSA